MEIAYLSPSQASSFLRCSVQWHLRWVDKAAGAFRPSITFARGKALDQAVQWYLVGRNTATVEQMEQVALGHLSREMAAPNIDRDIDAGLARDSLLEMVRAYHRDFSDIATSDTQVPVLWRVDGVQIKGYADIVADGAVWDLKGYSDSSREQHPANRDVQLMTYAAALKARRVGWLIVHPDGTTKRVDAEVSEADVARVASIYSTIIDAIRQERFVPADPSMWVCSPRFCPVWGACRWGGKGG